MDSNPRSRFTYSPFRTPSCHDNIFVERLWWTVKHEWVYLRPATNGIEQKRSLGAFFDWYNLRRPHQALGWRTPDEAYLGQSTAATLAA